MKAKPITIRNAPPKEKPDPFENDGEIVKNKDFKIPKPYLNGK